MKALLHKITTSQSGYSALALRIPIGIIFMAHGAQKLFGWFGGYGLEAHRTMDGINWTWPWRIDGISCW